MTTGTLNSTSTSAFVGGGAAATMGTSTASSTLGFYGSVGVAQQTSPVAVATTAPVLSSYGLTYAQMAAMITAVNAIITAFGSSKLNIWA